MIATLELTETTCHTAVEQYLANMVGTAYRAERGQLHNGAWVFTVIHQRTDMSRIPAVGAIAVDAVSGQIQKLTDDQLRNMREAGAVQAAQERRELARDDNGYILRRHARIKANLWISDRIGLKVGAEGGLFIPLEPPVWRFAVCYHALGPLAVLDVNALTGQVEPLTDEQLQAIQENVCAIKRVQTQTAAA
jgi:hypothetical protein